MPFTYAQIALIADIHGNLPALEAVAEDLTRRGIERIFCLGDMCGRGPDGAEAIDWCREHCEVIIVGNWDLFIGNESEDKAYGYAHALGAERCAWLASLPLVHKMWISGHYTHLLHGRPCPMVNHAMMTEEGSEALAVYFDVIPDVRRPDLVGYADIHRQFKHDYHDQARTLFNIGSIGNSFSEATAHYAILRGEVGSERPAPLGIEFVSVPYDNAEAVRRARAAPWFAERYITPYEIEVTEGRWQPGI